MFDIEANRELLNNLVSLYKAQVPMNNRLYYYYLGITDVNNKAMMANEQITLSLEDVYLNEDALNSVNVGNYSVVNDAYDKRTTKNYIKKFIKEETSYSVGNDCTYTSISGNSNLITTLAQNTSHWKADHDINLCKYMLIFNKCFELYYIDNQSRICSKIITPRQGLTYGDNDGNVIYFLRFFRESFDTKNYIDLYTDTEIIHMDDSFNEVKERTPNVFGRVPVGIACLSSEGWLDSLYRDIKSLQDSYNQNLSDISSEITELRNAILAVYNISLTDDDIKSLKKNGVLSIKDTDKNHASAAYLVKNINDSFIQNTLDRLDRDIYEMAEHINLTEAPTSNTSSLALQQRLLSLKDRCTLNEKALANCIRTRIEIVLGYLNKLKNTNYDSSDVVVKFTPNTPSDDLLSCQIINQLGDKLSTETGLSLLSFINNPQNEMKKIQAEQKSMSVGNDFLDSVRNQNNNQDQSQNNQNVQ